MMNDKLYLKIEISEALRIISFIAAICVVMIHSNVDGKWNFMCSTLTGWAVPFFFSHAAVSFSVSETLFGGMCHFFTLPSHKKNLMCRNG